MERGVPTPLAASEIHGFNTTADLDIEKLFDDASKRWFRPNEIHALLSNYTLLKIQPQPVMNPGNGSLLLFDRNMLRNFRKDGHNWRKKKDGKTVQEAHEKLKIGNDERIHVYYARGEDDPNFYRRCYWLLDRKLERIVLVHYRQTSEDIANQQLSASVVCKDEYSLANSLHGSPVLSMSSGSGSNNMEASGSLGMSEEIHLSKDSSLVAGYDVSVDDKFTEFESRDLSIDMINKFDWTSLVQPQSSNYHDGQSGLDFRNHADLGELGHVQSNFSRLDHIDQQDDSCLQPFYVDQGTPMQAEALQSHNSLSQWDFIIDENPPASFNLTDVQTSDSHASKELPVVAAQPYQLDGVFVITDASPAWSYADEETKVIVVGFFHEAHKHLENSNMFLVFGDTYVPAERVQFGVYKSIIQPRTVGSTNFFLSLDKQTPISNTLNYDVRAPVNTENSSERDIEILIRLIRLLFSSNNRPSQSSTSSSTAMKGARRFRSTTLSLLEKDWTHLLKLIRNNGASSSSINQQLLELVVKNKLQEWLLSKIAEGQRTTEMDSQGLGVIHLCAVLNYTWAAHLFKVSGLSLDFRDVYGWTALHWAAYSGRVKMVAALLSSGANPSLVTDPTPEIPGGCTAADLASQAGYEGLAAFLAEKALAAHFAAMTLSGNARGPREPANPENIEAGNSEQEVLLKYSLAAYRNAADAADRIHSALRDRSLRLRVKAAQLSSSQANEVLIISALKIQKAYRDHNSRKMMKAAARIQGTFRTWQARKNFLALRRHAVKIQAAFRGLLVRLSYRKILWSVGVLEKAVLRWRMKRKGLRGLQIDGEEGPVASAQQENSASEEEFFRVSREQAEERVDRSVVRVQAMFRSHQAQQEYRKMKLAHDQAQLEYDEFTGYDGG